MTTVWIAAIGIAIFLIVIFFFVHRMARARRLPSALAHALRVELASLERMPDDARRVLEAEKIVDHALSVLGYRGTFAEKLRKAGARFRSVQSVWDAHKLRNRIAHERDVRVTKSQADAAVAAFGCAVRDIS